MSSILVAKPQHPFNAVNAHRRHPSAPVVVQPTRTPGVFSIKPQKQTPVRQLPSGQRQSARSGAKPAKANQVVRASTLTQALDFKHIAAQVPATPTPVSRGRSHAKTPKERVHADRSISATSSARGKHGRQPSPPLQTQIPSQAEVSVISSNIFDPFSDNSMISPPPSPTLARPSGQLARRRQNNAEGSPSPAHARAIPVPGGQAPKRVQYPTLSRSDPVPSHMQHAARPGPRRSSAYHEFPVCDDEEGDFPPSPPATPSRPAHTTRTPFAKIDMITPPRSVPVKGAMRNHRRAPSDGVFNMSSDEDVSTGPRGINIFSGLKAPVFTTPRAAAPRSREAGNPFFLPMTEEQQLAREADEKAGYFASSMFQNSPSPEELPDPLLL